MTPHAKHRTSFLAPFANLWRHRDLVLQMTRREVVGRYRGSAMGIAWSFFNPILMLLVYTFVFSVVFMMRWGLGGGEGRASFAVVLFVGMIVHGLFAEVANRAPGLIPATMGLAWFLAALGVYVRDIGQTIGIVTTVTMFLSPVFYPVSALPEPFQAWVHLNPLTFVIEEGHKVLLLGQLPGWGGLGLYLAVSLGVARGGFWWLQKTRKGFTDVV